MSTIAMSSPMTAAQRSGLTPRDRDAQRQKRIIKAARKGLTASGIPRRDIRKFAADMPVEAELVDNYWRDISDYNMRGFLWSIGLGSIRAHRRAIRKVYKQVAEEDPQLAPYAAMMFALGYDHTLMHGADGARVVMFWAGSVSYENAVAYSRNDLDDNILHSMGVVLVERRHNILLEKQWG